MRILSSEMTRPMQGFLSLSVEVEVNPTYKVCIEFDVMEMNKSCDVSFSTEKDGEILSMVSDNYLCISDVKAILRAIKKVLETVAKSNPDWTFFCEPTTDSRRRLYRRAGFQDYDEISMIYAVK